LSDGSSYNVQLPSGKDGVSITGATINSDGMLILKLSNGDTIDAGKINTTSAATSGAITPTSITASGNISAADVNGINVGATAQLKGQTVVATGNATVGGSLDVTGAVRARGNIWFDDTNHFANGADAWVRLWDKTGNYSKGFAAKNFYAAQSVIIGDWTISQDGNGYLTFLRPNGSKVIMNPTNPVGVPQRGI
jgi:hypothetical protein